MTSFKLDEIYDASLLIQKGLSKILSPSKDNEYKNLIDKIYSDDNFYLLTKRIAEGLLLDVVDVNEYGIVLSPLDSNSPFVMKLSHYRKELGVDDISNQDSTSKRALLSLILVAIPATFYPTAETLEDDDGNIAKKATVKEVSNLLRELSEKIISEKEDEKSIVYLQKGASYILELPDKIPNQKKDTFSSLYGAVSIIMRHFNQDDLLYFEEDKEDGYYLVKHKYRALLQNRIGSSLLENLIYVGCDKNVTD